MAAQKIHLNDLIGSSVELTFTTGDKVSGIVEATDNYDNVLLSDVAIDGEKFDKVLISATKVVSHTLLQ